jgi:prolyl 4-hydroxylase
MWPADYFGQVHWVTTKETQFKTVPKNEIKMIQETGLARVLKDDEPRLLADHRMPGEFNMTLKVLSCRPRVYEIENFLSEAEVDHIVDYANKATLNLSMTGQDDNSKVESKTKTRTSHNTWVGRETDQIYDTLYRRAADLMKIDESLLRYRDKAEHPEMDSKKSVAEQLQLVHYNHGQEYTAHHDFGYANVDNKHQPTRFATLLLYLNDVEEGGQTEFPRWMNGETSQGLLTTPKKGKAVLFYSFLPDGNLDDLSQHAAKPVRKGEKYLINLWVRDPIFEN